jgi:hypothetical protein
MAKEGIIMYDLFHSDLLDHINIVDTSLPHPDKQKLMAMTKNIFGDQSARLPTMIVNDIGIVTTAGGFHHTQLLKSLKER